jgi:hypothetical protein
VTKFNLSIDLFTQDVRDAVDVAQALRRVADRLVKFTSQPWSPYALSGTIHSAEGRRPIGTWSVDPEATVGLAVTAENDPDSRVHCPRCGEHIRDPKVPQELCATCARKEARP